VAELTEDRIARWARQLLVPGFGAAGQERLMASRVRVVGADAVAAPALIGLVQAGVGTLWIDDPDPVAPADLGGWLLAPAAQGQPRADASVAALAGFSRYVAVARYPVGGVPTATLVFASSSGQALASAEAARRARVPHVVAEVDGEGGSVVSVPVGAPCYACARGAGGAWRTPEPGAAALSALAGLELLQLIADPRPPEGRRLELVRGVTSVRVTARLPGCVCNPAAAEPGEPAS
jgi:adenylyltransferase/sulfurtransferase